jgi:hypothetical protein
MIAIAKTQEVFVMFTAIMKKAFGQCVEHYHSHHGRSPSNIEIAASLDVSVRTAGNYKKSMREEGAIMAERQTTSRGRTRIETVSRITVNWPVLNRLVGSVAARVCGLREKVQRWYGAGAKIRQAILSNQRVYPDIPQRKEERKEVENAWRRQLKREPDVFERSNAIWDKRRLQPAPD